MATIDELIRNGLLQRSGKNIRLTPQGRVLSNEVFQKFIAISSDALVS
jgi:coproporphyrinogen III oxidase-like Fe-S oxidoreductase